MSIKVEPSRFAVLKIEDDNTSSIDKNRSKNQSKSAPQNSTNKKNKNMSTQNSKNSQHSNKLMAEKSANCQNNFNRKTTNKITSPSESNNIPVNNSNPINSSATMHMNVATLEDQWEQWKQLDEKFVEQEFQEKLKQVLNQSKKENKNIIQNKETNNIISQENNSKNKKNKKKLVNEISSTELLTKDAPQIILNSMTTKVTHNNPQKINTIQEKVNDFESLCFEEQLEIKNQSITEIQKIVDNIQTEITDFKNKNQKLCQYLLQGETCNVSDLEKALVDLREKHRLQTDQLIHLSTDLEKERSKGHALKSELNKLKMHREAASK